MNDDNESVQQLTLYTGFKVPSPPARKKRARLNSLPHNLSSPTGRGDEDNIVRSRSVEASLRGRKLSLSSELIPTGGGLPALPNPPEEPHHDVWEIVLHNPLSRQIVLFNANANKFAVSTEVPIGKKFFSNLEAKFGYCRG